MAFAGSLSLLRCSHHALVPREVSWGTRLMMLLWMKTFFTSLTGGCGQQDHHLTQSESDLGLATSCPGLLTITSTSKIPENICSFSQENGSLVLIFDAIGFELDVLNDKQSTFIAPDSTMFNLVPGSSDDEDNARTTSLYNLPGDSDWKTRDDLILFVGSASRSSSWRVRYLVSHFSPNHERFHQQYDWCVRFGAN